MSRTSCGQAEQADADHLAGEEAPHRDGGHDQLHDPVRLLLEYPGEHPLPVRGDHHEEHHYPGGGHRQAGAAVVVAAVEASTRTRAGGQEQVLHSRPGRCRPRRGAATKPGLRAGRRSAATRGRAGRAAPPGWCRRASRAASIRPPPKGRLRRRPVGQRLGADQGARGGRRQAAGRRRGRGGAGPPRPTCVGGRGRSAKKASRRQHPHHQEQSEGGRHDEGPAAGALSHLPQGYEVDVAPGAHRPTASRKRSDRVGGWKLKRVIRPARAASARRAAGSASAGTR